MILFRRFAVSTTSGKPRASGDDPAGVMPYVDKVS